MANQELQMKAINISSDIDDIFESYQIDNLNNAEDLSEFITKIAETKRNFRRIHSQLKATDGQNYGELYPNFDLQLNELSESFRIASKK